MALVSRSANISQTARAQSSRSCPVVRAGHRAVSVRCSLENAASVAETQATSRRAAICALATVPAVLNLNFVPAAVGEGEYSLLRGFATPPTSYGGYGGNANETPKYTFEYPTGWKQEVPSKSEKGTQGIDSKVFNPRVKDQGAFVITLGRAGEDNKSFRLTNVDSTFAGFAGADYLLQDAIQSATNTEIKERDVDGNKVFDYDIDSPDYRYLSSVAVKDGKVFALFVRSPSRSFKRDEEKLRHIISTFKLF